MKPLKVAVVFGGTNTEHEVSIITALQLMHALLEYGHQVFPIYVSKKNSWHYHQKILLDPKTYRQLNLIPQLTKPCKVQRYQATNQLVTKGKLNRSQVISNFDIVYPVFHGLHGEDGTIQGFFQYQNIPIAGSNLISAAIGIDKYLSKTIAQSQNIPTVKDEYITRNEWQNNPSKIANKIQTLTYHDLHPK